MTGDHLHLAAGPDVPDPDRLLMRAGAGHQGAIRRVRHRLSRGAQPGDAPLRPPGGEVPDADRANQRSFPRPKPVTGHRGRRPGASRGPNALSRSAAPAPRRGPRGRSRGNRSSTRPGSARRVRISNYSANGQESAGSAPNSLVPGPTRRRAGSSPPMARYWPSDEKATTFARPRNSKSRCGSSNPRRPATSVARPDSSVVARVCPSAPNARLTIGTGEVPGARRDGFIAGTDRR